MWLGKKNDQFVAMKQFPKKAGNLADSSAHLELQIHNIILKHSNKEGKYFIVS